MMIFKIYKKYKSGGYCHGENEIYIIGKDEADVVQKFIKNESLFRIEKMEFVGVVQNYCFEK